MLNFSHNSKIQKIKQNENLPETIYIYQIGKAPQMCQSVLLVKLCALLCSVAQSCPTLCDPMDCSPPGSSVHGILQSRILEWVAMPSSNQLYFIWKLSMLKDRRPSRIGAEIPACPRYPRETRSPRRKEANVLKRGLVGPVLKNKLLRAR